VQFLEAIELTQSAEAKRTLDALAKLHESRAEILRHIERTDATNHLTTNQPVSREDITGHLATARGMPDPSKRQSEQQDSPTNRRKGKAQADNDPFIKFYTSVNNIFSRALTSATDKSREETQIQSVSPSSSSHVDISHSFLGNVPRLGNESFIFVPKASNMSIEELATENANLRQLLNRATIQIHAHEQAIRKQKDVLKNSILTLKNELTKREIERTRQQELEIEALRNENDKLKIQIGRLKTRWDDLKESARRRREEDGREDEAAKP
jgi:hypothetical protein